MLTARVPRVPAVAAEMHARPDIFILLGCLSFHGCGSPGTISGATGRLDLIFDAVGQTGPPAVRAAIAARTYVALPLLEKLEHRGCVQLSMNYSKSIRLFVLKFKHIWLI